MYVDITAKHWFFRWKIGHIDQSNFYLINSSKFIRLFFYDNIGKHFIIKANIDFFLIN